MLQNIFSDLVSASGLVLRRRTYKALTAGLGVVLIFSYMVLLPSLILGKITVEALGFITPIELVFSVLIGSALSLVVVMNVYAFRRSMRATCARKTVAFSIVASILPNSLCCGPLVPTVIGFMVVSTSVLFTVAPAIQSFLARYAVLFYSASFLSLLYSLQLIARDVVRLELPGTERQRIRKFP